MAGEVRLSMKKLILLSLVAFLGCARQNTGLEMPKVTFSGLEYNSTAPPVVYLTRDSPSLARACWQAGYLGFMTVFTAGIGGILHVYKAEDPEWGFLGFTSKAMMAAALNVLSAPSGLIQQLGGCIGVAAFAPKNAVVETVH